MGKKHIDDKFYTKSEIAKYCISTIDLNEFDNIVEPSAGNGAFSNIMNCTAYDINPENDTIIKMDFFEVNLSDARNTLIIGNPPFGDRNSLSKGFIKHALQYKNVTAIAFILPQTWNKFTLQKTFPSNWDLTFTDNLPYNSFTLNGNDYHVPCVWQVWEKNSNKIDLRDIEKTSHPRFSITSTYNANAQFFILGAAPSRVIHIDEVNPTQRGYYIETLDTELYKEFERIKWNVIGNSGVNGGAAWLTKSEIYKAIEN